MNAEPPPWTHAERVEKGPGVGDHDGNVDDLPGGLGS
jgi:hypothetical protein